MSKKTKLIGFGVGVLVIVGILGFSASKKGTKAVEVKIEPVERRDLIASVTASGQVRPQTKVDVASDVSGKIIKLAVKEGQIVTAGQFLLQIDQAQPLAAVQRSEAMVASSRAQLAQAQSSLDGAEKNYARSAARRRSRSTPSPIRRSSAR